MNQTDADVVKLYQQIKQLEVKVDKLTKLVTRVEKIEAYINHLHNDLKLVGTLVHEVQSQVEPILKALDGIGSFLIKSVSLVMSRIIPK